MWSEKGKEHYNPPRDLIGERQPYCNYALDSSSEHLVIVEGQADAISFAEWGIPALALGGMRLSDDMLTTLRGYRRVFVALDNTDDAREQSHRIGQALGGRAYLPQLPEGVKDANEWLAVHLATADDAHAMLNQAPCWLMSEVERVGHLEGLAQEDAIRGLFHHAHDLDALALTRFKTMMAGLGIQGRAFNDLLKAGRAENKSHDTDEETTEVFNDNIPVLSPALGFSHDLALVTVSLRERSKNNRLNVQPYLVTSTRELIRLKDQQILTIHDQEIALRVVPEGSEFLMRWRYNDIQRFLKGEEVQPGDVFRVVHDLFTTYVDFRSPVESRILTLWTIGTYFYTMFPAYPYLALNGPKNRRTDRKMPFIPPDFDGAALRHQLYVLALTAFQHVYSNYFERSELHTLHNRSGGLWSPLVAPAAFFEERGGIIDLLAAISQAAEWDEQTSEGKTLSERKAAVLQALESMTRSSQTEVWIKASDLRGKVRELLGYDKDLMGHAQWIGHILNRLQLTDRNRRKAYTEGQMYLIQRAEVIDMMRRYAVEAIALSQE